MTNTRPELEVALEMHKEQLRDTLDELGQRVRGAADWRTQYRRHPAIFVGTAIASGMLLGAASRGEPRRARRRPAMPLRPFRAEPKTPSVRDALIDSVMAWAGSMVVPTLGYVLQAWLRGSSGGRRR
jgi:hypothetical protein